MLIMWINGREKQGSFQNFIPFGDGANKLCTCWENNTWPWILYVLENMQKLIYQPYTPNHHPNKNISPTCTFFLLFYFSSNELKRVQVTTTFHGLFIPTYVHTEPRNKLAAMDGFGNDKPTSSVSESNVLCIYVRVILGFECLMSVLRY